MALTEEEEDELDRLQLEKLRREDAAIRKQEAIREREVARKREILRRRAALREARSLKRELRRQQRSRVWGAVVTWLLDSESDLAEILRMTLFIGALFGGGGLFVFLSDSGWFDWLSPVGEFLDAIF